MKTKIIEYLTQPITIKELKVLKLKPYNIVGKNEKYGKKTILK